MRAGEADPVQIAKLSAAVLKLAQLKFLVDDVECKFIAAAFSVLKTGVSFGSAVDKYNSTGDTAALRISKDHENKSLLKLGAGISCFLDARAAFETLMKEEGAAACEKSPMFGFDAPAVFGAESLGKWDTFFDSLGLQCQKIDSQVQRCGSNLKQLCKNMEEGGENHWRASLGDDVDIATLRSAAKTSLKSLDGTQLKSAVESTAKAGWGWFERGHTNQIT